MLPASDLRRALNQISPLCVQGPFSRFVPFRYVAQHRPGPPPRPLWGIGSFENGGRYNAPRTFEVIYLAEDAITALAEVDLVFRPSGLNIGKIKGQPMVHISIDGLLERVLDVTLIEVQQTLGTGPQQLTGSWLLMQSAGREAPTQELGRIAHASQHFCGLRYPSSKNPGGVCVAVFPERLTGSSYLEVYDPYGNLAQRLSS
jgi:RES domain-containing protein